MAYVRERETWARELSAQRRELVEGKRWNLFAVD
jgi:hypothetical protein